MRKKLHTIIFEADTLGGKLFDIMLLLAIGASTLILMLGTVEEWNAHYASLFDSLEWGFTILFTIEYILRVWIIRDSKKYIFSLMGMVDLLSTLPSYLALIIPGGELFIILRIIRILRVFRVFKLARYIEGGNYLYKALVATRGKIIAFLAFVLCIVVIVGTLIYVIEGPQNGFKSIPESIYWAIVTLTTVGYGDMSPKTGVGQALASLIMILGYGILAVPTGLVSVEAIRMDKSDLNTQSCPNCAEEGHDKDAKFCKACGASLHSEEN